jgi:hypothetical protein
MMARHGRSEHLVKYLGGQDSAFMRKGVVHLSNGINHMYDPTLLLTAVASACCLT